MSLFDSIKRFFIPEKTKTTLPELKEVSLNSIEDAITEVLTKEAQKKEEVKQQLKRRAASFCAEIESHIQVLKGVNIEHKREYDKLKTISMESLKWYIFYLDRFQKELKDAEQAKSEEYLLRVNKAIVSFEKNAKGSYEKATILIGKELEQARSIIVSFLADYNNIIAEKRDSAQTTNALYTIKSNANELNEIDAGLADIELKRSELSEQIITFEKEESVLKEGIDGLKQSPDYQNNMTQKEKERQEKEKLKQDIINLKKEMDFKALLHAFHEDPKKKKLIEGYRDSFVPTLQKDIAFEILELVLVIKPDANLGETLREIKSRCDRFTKRESAEIELKISQMEQEIARIIVEKAKLNTQIAEYQKRTQRFSERKEQVKNSLLDKAKFLEWKIVEKNADNQAQNPSSEEISPSRSH